MTCWFCIRHAGRHFLSFSYTDVGWVFETEQLTIKTMFCWNYFCFNHSCNVELWWLAEMKSNFGSKTGRRSMPINCHFYSTIHAICGLACDWYFSTVFNSKKCMSVLNMVLLSPSSSSLMVNPAIVDMFHVNFVILNFLLAYNANIMHTC